MHQSSNSGSICYRLIDAYKITKKHGYPEKIKEIADFILKNFYDDENYGFFDRVIKEGDFGRLVRRDRQFLENSFCAVVFLKLYSMTKEENYRQVAENTLLYFLDNYLNYGYFSAMYAIAVDMLLNGMENDSI